MCPGLGREALPSASGRCYCLDWLYTGLAKRKLAAAAGFTRPRRVQKDTEDVLYGVSIEVTQRVGGCFALAECRRFLFHLSASFRLIPSHPTLETEKRGT